MTLTEKLAVIPNLISEHGFSSPRLCTSGRAWCTHITNEGSWPGATLGTLGTTKDFQFWSAERDTLSGWVWGIWCYIPWLKTWQAQQEFIYRPEAYVRKAYMRIPCRRISSWNHWFEEMKFPLFKKLNPSWLSKQGQFPVGNLVFTQILPELLSYGATLDLGLGHKNLYEIVQFLNFQMV